MQITEMKLEDIKPYGRNPRKNDAAVDAVASSIREFGAKVPIVVDSDGVIVAGHTRYKAAMKLGMESFPCIVASDLTPKQVKAFRLADNKVGEIAEWDFDMLGGELGELLDFDMGQFGFEFGMDDASASSELNEDVVPEVDVEGEAVCRRGEVWKLGRHRLMCGDSTSEKDVAKLMDGNTAQLCVTDPPYNVEYEGKTSEKLTIQNDRMSSDSFRKFLTEAFSRIEESIDEGSAFYIWHASREAVNFETALNEAGLFVRQQLVWVKNAMVLGRQDYQWKHEPCFYGWKDGASHNWHSDRKQTTVLEFDKPARNGEHPTMKPLDLIGYQISNSSEKGQVVLDLFGGSGTTLIASEQLGRTCYMMELDPKYCDVIVKRWENLTGLYAERIEKR